jgi:Matrixin
MKRIAFVGVVVALTAVAAFVAQTDVRADEGGVPANPTQVKSVGHGLELTVTVDLVDEEHQARPGGGGSCADTDQSGFADPFAGARSGGLTMKVNTSTFPSSVASGALSALQRAGGAWNGVRGGYFSIAGGSTKTGPAQDGENSIGWVKLVPRKVLAATWTWTDANGRIVEADVFYNNSHPWGILVSCGGSSFDVQDIGTHELGHAVGLSHFSDSGAQATMYPSAPAGEVRKNTLTTGDKAAFGVSLG